MLDNRLVGVHASAEAVTPHDFTLLATDQYPLGARLWASVTPPLTTALINAGAGIDMRHYDAFAQYLATHGVPTLLYDYRGIGRSRPRLLRGFEASVEDWGSKDCAAALEWMNKTFPRARRVVIGHSVGGFLTGFVTNGDKIDRMLLVAAHTGFWRDYAAHRRTSMYLLWHVLMPAVTKVVGYFPGRRLRLRNDLPAGIALEWANRRRGEFWWNRMTPNGTIDTQWRDEIIGRFLGIRAPTLAIRFADDAFATGAATDRILGLFKNCSAETVVLGPEDAGSQRIGHFGFFRRRFSGTLWPRALTWLLSERVVDEERIGSQIAAPR